MCVKGVWLLFLVGKGLKRVILAIVHVKKHHMLGHVLAFGQENNAYLIGSDKQRILYCLVKELIHKGLKRVILAIVHVKKHHMLGHVLAFGLGIFHANCQGGFSV